jgi:hypothetical protein
VSTPPVLVDQYVKPHYLRLIHGNFLSMTQPDRGHFLHSMLTSARQITDDEIQSLLRFGWREQITGAFLAGMGRRSQFRDRIGELLLDSVSGYAGHGYTFALASFGSGDDAEILELYLEHWLAQTDCQYDQPWAIGALLHLDLELGTDYAGRFLGPDGPWQNWSTAIGIAFDPHDYRRMIHEMCYIADYASQPW